VAIEVVAWAVAGALLSFALLAAFDPHNQASDLDIVAIVVGAVAAVGINRILRG